MSFRNPIIIYTTSLWAAMLASKWRLDLRTSIFDLAASSATVPRWRRLSSPRTGRILRDSLEPVYEATSRYALEHIFGRKPEASRGQEDTH